MGIEARLERFKLIRTIILLWSVMFLFGMQTKEASPEVEISYKRSYTMDTLDHSKKRILARGCDPHLSLAFSKKIPPYIGNPEYVPTTNDEDFFHKLNTEKWSVVYFAPGACRYSAAKKRIPGTNQETKTWTLDEYKKLALKLQGEDIQFAESIYEEDSIEKLKEALALAKDVK